MLVYKNTPPKYKASVQMAWQSMNLIAACFFNCVSHLSYQRYYPLGLHHEKQNRSKTKRRHSLAPHLGDPGNAVARCRW